MGSLSCMDILHGNGLVNYFGRIDSLDEIEVSPVLIVKVGFSYNTSLYRLLFTFLPRGRPSWPSTA